MINSEQILEKLLQAESHSPLFHILNKTLEVALENEARIAEIEAQSRAKQEEAEIEASKKLELYTKLSETTSPRLALASIFGTPKAVESELKNADPMTPEAEAKEEFDIIIKSCNEDKPDPKLVSQDFTELGNMMIKVMKIDESLLSEDIKKLKDYKVLEKKYLDLEGRLIFKDKYPQLSEMCGRGAVAAPNLGKCKPWFAKRLMDKYPELSEVTVNEQWKLMPALYEKCKELRGDKF